MKEKVAVFWFRRDLRLNDNAGLFHALKSGLPVVPVFIFDKEILVKLSDKTDARVSFIHQQLSEINLQLKVCGSSLSIWNNAVIPSWKLILENWNVAAVFVNEDYEPLARQRDETINALLNDKGIPLYSYKDQVIFNPLEVLKDNGQPYTIYTPYKNRWRRLFSDLKVPRFDSGNHLYACARLPFIELPKLQKLGFEKTTISFPALNIDESLIERYDQGRDFPALNGTSRLGIHFRFGTISIRDWILKTINKSETWVNELIWREFYMMILWHFPHVIQSAFKPAYNYIRWRNDESEFVKWCTGNTGYPIVDAGMRELNQTGFMHNRLRMITASFLSKHLLVDWRWGEAYFASRLLDFELSSNNGGWQWAAGTGCDAAPYFRIFNPYEQTRKFDSAQNYIQRWVPEVNSSAYPDPVIEHAFARQRCLETYKVGLEKGGK